MLMAGVFNLSWLAQDSVAFMLLVAELNLQTASSRTCLSVYLWKHEHYSGSFTLRLSDTGASLHK
jgi:hypothetical protein